MKNLFFFLLTTKYHILYSKNMKRTANNPDFAEKFYFNITMTSQFDVRPACGLRAADRFLSYPRAGTGM